MGYKLINYIEAIEQNTKRFFLDNGSRDLPPITNQTDIKPGSEAHDINTMDMWILNSNYEWEKCPWKKRKCGGGATPEDVVPEAPTDTPNAEYIRYTRSDGINDWKKVSIIPEIPDGDKGAVYVRKDNGDGTFSWVKGTEDAPVTTPGAIYARQTDIDGSNKWVEIDPSVIKTMTTNTWKMLADKPDYTEITDGIYDGIITKEMYIE